MRLVIGILTMIGIVRSRIVPSHASSPWKNGVSMRVDELIEAEVVRARA